MERNLRIMRPVMRHLYPAIIVLVAGLFVSAPALAQDQATPPPPPDQGASAPPAQVIEYSDAYKLRAKIHKTASLATLPLFAAEGFVGESLYNNPTDAKKGAHLAIATGIGALFAVNTVTGVWNLIESRHDPNHRTIRWVHGILMLAADGGFLATAALGPGDDGFERRLRFFEGGDGGNRSLHRTMAFTSIGLASAGYAIMLFGGH
jgi:hypothetical protein